MCRADHRGGAAQRRTSHPPRLWFSVRARAFCAGMRGGWACVHWSSSCGDRADGFEDRRQASGRAVRCADRARLYGRRPAPRTAARRGSAGRLSAVDQGQRRWWRQRYAHSERAGRARRRARGCAARGARRFWRRNGVPRAPDRATPPCRDSGLGRCIRQLRTFVRVRMLDHEGRYYFLEMNTRLQVEHPVTEAVTGLDLAQLQIAIAAGERLPFQQADLVQRGHAIEARVYAEDPVTFLPSAGHVALFAPPSGPGIRNDIGLASGDEVTLNYDPMLAKLIVAAPDRTAAIARLRRALEEYVVLGVTTNLPLLRAIAAHADFAAGATSTDFLGVAGLASASFDILDLPPEVLMAAAIWDNQSITKDPWHSGSWRLMGDGVRRRYVVDEAEYSVVVTRAADRWRVESAGATRIAAVVAQQANQITLEFGDQRIERFSIACDGAERLIAWRGANFRLAPAAWLSVDALGARATGPHGHASLVAPMPGTVIKVLAEEGRMVAAQQPLVVLEAMKMEHIVVAPYDGMVQKLFFRPGALVAKGATLVELEPVMHFGLERGRLKG